ncbi:peptidoglycan editing factor PgeF [Brachybacterium endophyticum]|uniref:Purine nucleoside phosphorylase n=1 Tax=Brachybacterium endophyticum TaxID=2182385 RepID=A0A2U2RLT2_9MICO|nr:peptidoglycan editing factor PgeF [Brachybacterium endophyticum]PWH06796.1 peptidoglycan editing factor PgeF [Brachybacterium endophyticum]
MTSPRPSAVHGARVPQLRGARALFSAREGGVSVPPFASLNLAHHVGDDPSAVERNREVLAGAMGAPLVFVDQVHSDRVHVPDPGAPGPVTADALVTDREDVALAIMVADCLPVLLSDPAAGVVGAAHAGRAGLLGGVLENTLARMVDLGGRPERLEVTIGPGICGACYEVPEQMREEARAVNEATWTTTRAGTPGLDLRAGAVEVLVGQGVPRASIDDDHPCTLEDPAFFSYRGQERTGRFAGVIRRATAERD